MNELERRYRWLLRTYPQSYRQYRADEMLETLLATAENERRRPSLRESAALVLGGLRARTGLKALRSPAALRQSVLRLATLSLLAYGVVLLAEETIKKSWSVLFRLPYDLPTWWAAVPLALMLLALIATAWCRYRLALAATVLTFITNHLYAGFDWESTAAPVEDAGIVVLLQRNLANQWPQVSSVESLGQAIEFGTWPGLLATLAIMPLLRAPRQRVERPWIWLIVTALAVAIMTPNPLNGWTHGQQRPILVGVLVAAALLGVVIDLRIPVVASALTLVPMPFR